MPADAPQPLGEAVAAASRIASRRGGRASHRPSGRASDVFGGELRRRDLFPLLALHLIRRKPVYGNALIEQIESMTRGAITVNPNTMYPLLRDLEGRGLIVGRWEHPDRRSRRFYEITPSGEDEYRRLREDALPFLESVIESMAVIRDELSRGDDVSGAPDDHR